MTASGAGTDRGDNMAAYSLTLLRNPHYDFTMSERKKLAVEIAQLRAAASEAHKLVDDYVMLGIKNRSNFAPFYRVRTSLADALGLEAARRDR